MSVRCRHGGRTSIHASSVWRTPQSRASLPQASNRTNSISSCQATKIHPLVAGPGVQIETVNSGLLMPSYIRVSARLWAAGFIAANGTKVSSYGQVDYQMNGSFSDRRQIRLDQAHPQGRRCAHSMSPDVGARALLTFNAFAEIDPRIFTFWISTPDGQAGFRDFTFVIH